MPTKDSQTAPVLYLLPSTLADTPPTEVMPERNIEIARSVTHFIVENIRTARRFLKRCDRNIDIDSLTFYVLDEHTAHADIPAMLTPMEQGHSMAIISEAGCPAVADPGADAVAEAQRRGFTVCPLIGPSSILLALMASGFNGQTFTFAGYLPVDTAERTAALRRMHHAITAHRTTQIFIETPYRNRRVIPDLCKVLPPSTLLCVATDITGPEQSIITRPLSWWTTHADLPKLPTIFLLYS